MTPTVVFALTFLAIASLADLRYRTAPGAELFFLAAVWLGARSNPLGVGLVILAVCWGIWPHWPTWLSLPVLTHPPSWILLLVGAGVRRELVGRADLLALGGLACLLEWPALVTALVGVQVWQWLWKRRKAGPVPALPGIFLGLGSYTFLMGLYRISIVA